MGSVALIFGASHGPAGFDVVPSIIRPDHPALGIWLETDQHGPGMAGAGRINMLPGPRSAAVAAAAGIPCAFHSGFISSPLRGTYGRQESFWCLSAGRDG